MRLLRPENDPNRPRVVLEGVQTAPLKPRVALHMAARQAIAKRQCTAAHTAQRGALLSRTTA